ncbi:DUF4917 family protein [Consotaella salsifontis]|uniref:DUF4917 domain-containing protein n=1 Tax=Consotaella salsifontis TaxID=1365950 RepID=A0A1T4STW3_9HYPH|nr:DUF4917 family protein [Consotaella salsifontis]SKA31629.1 protein of unknown function [Consotaella salsifontis]
MVDELDNELADWKDLRGLEDWSGLLIGNGFSQNIWRSFGYTSLFEAAKQKDGAHLSDEDVALFDRLQTRNFEVVLSALATSKAVATALGQPHEHLVASEESIRSALVRAVHAVHIPWLNVPDATLDRVATELATYASVYCTNYDLLLYWSMMRDTSAFRDYFWTKKFDIANTEVWGKKSKMHFLHGGLHLYRKPTGQTLKRSAQPGQNLLDLFAVQYGDATPLFISEGTAEEKLTSIYRSDYLSFVFSCLVHDPGPLVIFGHGLGDSDKHIVEVIGAHQGRSIAVSLRPGGNVRQKKAAIIEALPNAALHFYDASTHPLGAADLQVENPD